jgi:hypothetical protein
MRGVTGSHLFADQSSQTALDFHYFCSNSFFLSRSDSPPRIHRGACFLGTIPHVKPLLRGLVVKFVCVNFCHKVEIVFPRKW